MARVIIACRRTVAGRLYLVGGLALAAVLSLAIVSIYYALTTRRAADRLYEAGLVRAVEAGEIELLLEKHRRLIEAAPRTSERAQMSRDRLAAGEAARRIDLIAGSVDAAFSAEIGVALVELWASGEDVLRQAEGPSQGGASAALDTYIARAEGLQETVRSHRADRVLGVNREANTLSQSAWALVHAATGISIIASLLIGPLSFVLLRGMVLRLENLTQSMRRLANNDTGIDISGVGDRDEIGDMVRAMAVFKDNAVKLLEQQNQLEQLNRRLDIALNNMARGLSMFDGEHRLIVCNAAYVRMYHLPESLTEPGVTLHQILQHRRSIVTGLDEPDETTSAGDTLGLKDGGSQTGAVAQAIEQFASTRREGQLRQRTIDGRTLDIIVKPLPWGGWVALHEDVTSRVQDAEKITRLARQDTLTGLANRHAFCESLSQAMAELGPQEIVALLAIDLDRFKEVNDALGHPTGDALLASVGARLTGIVRRGDMVARLGGDEFAIIQRGVTCRADAEALARRVIETLHQPFQIHQHRVEIGGTVGIALAPEDGTTSADLMKNADIALYRAKGERRGTFHFYDPAMEGRLRSRRTLETDLGKAVARGELELHYQPIVCLADGKVSGCEALIRWRHRDRGLVSPADFIPIAEETGLICEIGAWALEEACMAAQRWPAGLRVAVNLSAAQFNGPDLAMIAAMALDRSGLAPGRLELEVTESLLLGDDPATLALMHRLRDLGIGIALDDFGTGYSSLSHLRSFPFDKIKIDQTFVRDLPQKRNCEAIVGAVARLASSLDMTTVAEGVETEDHLERVRVAGCNEVQGYLFSRPVPEAQLADVIADIDGRMAGGALAA